MSAAMLSSEGGPAATTAAECAAATPHNTSTSPFTDGNYREGEAQPGMAMATMMMAMEAADATLAASAQTSEAATARAISTVMRSRSAWCGAAATSPLHASPHTSSATATTPKQHQRLLARRHLNKTRRLHPRMSTLEAKMIVRDFTASLGGVTLAERRLADEAVFWEESAAMMNLER